MRREYQVVYDYERNGEIYTITVGNGEWIPDYEIAKKIVKHKQARPLYKDEILYLKVRHVDTEDTRTPNDWFNGKPVVNPEHLWWDAMEIGDYVNDEIADNILDALTPACMRSDCLQLGEPTTDRYDENTGKWRATYLTLKKIAENVWEYCGDCFRGENVQRGKEMQYA